MFVFSFNQLIYTTTYLSLHIYVHVTGDIPRDSSLFFVFIAVFRKNYVFNILLLLRAKYDGIRFFRKWKWLHDKFKISLRISYYLIELNYTRIL